jgi:glycosyltransferase involved in cell wall biosynthesis
LRILFLHEVNYLEKPIFEMHEFPEHLASRGHDVGFVHFPEGYELDEVRSLGWKSEIAGRVVNESRITLYTPQFADGSFFGRVRTALRFRKEFRRIVRDFRPDVVVSFAVPTSGWQALRVCSSDGIPYVFRALDVSHKIRQSILSPFIRVAERYIYGSATWLSANNPAMLEYCQKEGRRQGNSSTDLPPLDLSHFNVNVREGERWRSHYGIPHNARVILYMGSFFYFSGLPQAIEEFSGGAANQDFLCLIGGGEQDAELRSQVARLGIENRVIFTGFVGFKELPGHLAMGDVAINPMLKSLVSDTAFPNKVLQYMAAGLPVISTNLAGLQRTFRQSRGLRFASTPSFIVREARRMLLEEKDLDSLGEANVAAVSGQFSRDDAVRAFESRLTAISHRGNQK